MICFAWTFLGWCAIVLAAFDVRDHPNWHLLDHEGCGQSVTDRIIGGTKASLGQFPWMARIGYTKMLVPKPKLSILEIVYAWLNRKTHMMVTKAKPPVFKCAGSLINDMYVVTAAHCLVPVRNEIVTAVRLGEYDVRTDPDCDENLCLLARVQDFKPMSIIIHEMYNKPSMRNDLGLIRLDRPAELHSYVNPICLPFGPLLAKDYYNTTMEVAGWGSTDPVKQRSSPVLLHVNVPIVDNGLCDEAMRLYTTTGPGQLCAGGTIGYDSCGGDSGGPLMQPASVDGPPKYFLMGLVSFGSKRCGSDAPAVYTNVVKYVRWILDNIGP